LNQVNLTRTLNPIPTQIVKIFGPGTQWGVVVGRKNHYGSRSKRGTEVAALFYTMMETAKLSGIDARTYLRQAATQAIKKPGTITLPTDLT